MSGLRYAVLLALGLLGQASPACARPAEVRIELRHELSGWVATYIFAGQSPVWFFPRTKDSIDGVAFRSVAFRPETPGVALARFAQVAGAQAAARVATFIDRGVADPEAFWIDLLLSVDLHARREGDTLLLE